MRNKSLVKRLLLIALFPIGMLYCIGKNLWSKDLASFLGGIFLFLAGFIVSIVLLRPDIIDKIVSFFTL